MDIYDIVLLSCGLVGFLVAYVVNYKHAVGGLQELVLFFGGTCYHIHHWEWAFVFIAMLLIGTYTKDRRYIWGIVAFLIGLSLEDLLFRRSKNPCHRNQIVRLLKRLSKAS